MFQLGSSAESASYASILEAALSSNVMLVRLRANNEREFHTFFRRRFGFVRAKEAVTGTVRIPPNHQECRVESKQE